MIYKKIILLIKKVQANRYMHKINLNNLVYIIFILGISFQTKPMFTSSIISFAQKIASRSATIGWASYISTHYFQKKKIDHLKSACIHSPENTSQDYNSQLNNPEDNYPLTMSFFYKTTLLGCMKNKNKNLKNFNACINFSNKITESE